MLTPAAASTLLTSILILASSISAQALNGPQITKPTASAIQFRHSHGTNHTSNAHIVQRDRGRIRHKYEKQSRRAGLVAPKTGSAPPSKRDVTRTPRLFDIKAKRDGESGAEPMLAKYEDGAVLAYYGTLSIGTDPQETTVLFDTGSSDLVVPLTQCVSCIGPLFDASESTTYDTDNTPFRVTFADDSSVEGAVASDTVTLAGLTFRPQTFGAAYRTRGFSGPYAGILGLGFPANSKTESIPFFGNLVREVNLQSNAFSFYMTKDGSDGSELCLGCINSERFEGEINYHAVVTFADNGEALAWDIECTGISIKPSGSSVGPSEHWESEGLEATIDSGTAFIYVPQEVAQELYGQFPYPRRASRHWGKGSYAFPCDTVDEMGEVTFEFGGDTYDVNWRDLIAGHESDDSDECVGAIFGSDDQDDGTAIFGLSFMKNVYSVFDYEGEAVGFAELR